MKKIAFLAISAFATGAWAQTTDNVFQGTCEDGRRVHVVPTTEVLERHFGAKPSLAEPSNTASVYAPSYGNGPLIGHGGPEISNAGFQAIYWNSSVATSTSTSNGFATIQSQTDAFIQAFGDGQNWDDSKTDDYTIIQQYGTGSQIAPSLRLNPENPAGGAFIDSQAPVSEIKDAQVQTYLAGLFRTGKLLADSHTVYGVFFPAGTTVHLNSQQQSCTHFCGYHARFYYNNRAIIYAVFPYPSCGNCNPFNYAAADMLTMFIGHETREAVTDSYGAWHDASNYESDDKCVWSHLYRTANGHFFVQPEYSNGGTVTASGFTATYPGPGCVVPGAPCAAPSAPTDLVVTATSAQISLTWNAVSRAGGYNVKRGTTPGGEANYGTTASNAFTDFSVVPGVTYYYVVSALASCGGHTESHNSTEARATPSQADFTISASSGPQTLAQGGQTALTVTTVSLGGFSGAVTLTVSGLPLGVTASFTPSSVNGAGTSVLTLVASGGAPTGEVALVITGTSGSSVRSTVVTLTVTAGGLAPDYTVSAAPASQSITRGSSAAFSVSVTPRNGFNLEVTLAVSGVPKGARLILRPTSILNDSAGLTITAGQRTSPGTYTLTITGMTGSLSHTTQVTLLVH